MRLGNSGIATTEPLLSQNGAFVGNDQVANLGAFMAHFTRGPTSAKISACGIENEGAADDIIFIDEVRAFTTGAGSLMRIGRGSIQLGSDGGPWESLTIGAVDGVGHFRFEDLDSVAGLMVRFAAADLDTSIMNIWKFKYPIRLAQGESIIVSNETANINLNASFFGREFIA